MAILLNLVKSSVTRRSLIHATGLGCDGDKYHKSSKKNPTKCGKLSDKTTMYRPVAISNSLSKVFELILLDIHPTRSTHVKYMPICGLQKTN